MCKPAFLVEGQTEQIIIQNLFPNTTVKLINCNGSGVELNPIFKRLLTLVTLLNNKYYPIVIVFDREDRNEESEEIASKLFEMMIAERNEQYVIGIPDRMFENWILADWENFKEYTKTTKSKHMANFEGCKGASSVKKHYPSYHKTTDGVNIFLNANKKEIGKNSISFNKFMNRLEKLNCELLNKIYNS